MNNSSRFSPYLFWDIDERKLDYIRDRVFIIERVLVYGSESDERLMFETYNTQAIKRIAVKSMNLNERTASYLSAILNIPKEKFKCYKKPPYYLNY